MRDEMLFIDGELVDLDENTKITLNYKSNLFTDLSKIVGNNSYTIKLPNTVRNQRIIQHADLPACDTSYPRTLHNARYFRNGVEVIPKAKAILMSVSDGIEIALTWGNATVFSSIVEGGKKLTELPYLLGKWASIGEDYREWKDWGENDRLYPQINYGFKLAEEKEVWYHPVVYVKEILDKIASANGVRFIFSTDKLAEMESWFVPLLTRNGSEKYSEMCAITLVCKKVVIDPVVKRYMINFVNNLDSNYYGRATTLGTGTSDVDSYCSFISNGVVRLTGHVEVTIQSNSTPSLPTLVVYNFNESGSGAKVDASTVLEISPLDISPSGTANQYKVIYDFKQEKTSVLKNVFDNTKWKYIRFSFDNIGDAGKVLSVSGKIKVANIEEKVIRQIYTGSNSIDGLFWIVPNLPEIKQIDFIKAITSMLGVFAIAKSDTEIHFVAVDKIIENKSKALNWTRKVIASYKENKPMEMKFTLDGFAQRNKYYWKNDNNDNDYSGYLKVDDQTISYENNVMTLPFSPTDMYKGIAKIPLYSYDEEGKLQYSKVEPRLLVLSGTRGVFEGIDWSTLLSKNYRSYQSIIRKPIIITEKIEISEYDLKELDVTVPIYLGQYGRYYAPIEIKAENTGVCECKLLQLEV